MEPDSEQEILQAPGVQDHQAQVKLEWLPSPRRRGKGKKPALSSSERQKKYAEKRNTEDREAYLRKSRESAARYLGRMTEEERISRRIKNREQKRARYQTGDRRAFLAFLRRCCSAVGRRLEGRGVTTAFVKARAEQRWARMEAADRRGFGPVEPAAGPGQTQVVGTACPTQAADRLVNEESGELGAGGPADLKIELKEEEVEAEDAAEEEAETGQWDPAKHEFTYQEQLKDHYWLQAIGALEDSRDGVDELEGKTVKKDQQEMKHHWTHQLNQQDPAGGPKKRTYQRDPNLPKRAPSGYLLFCEAKRPRVRAALGGRAGLGEVARELGLRWSAAGSEERARWGALAAAGRARYHREKELYQRGLQLPGGC
jgi:hypothetical protein